MRNMILATTLVLVTLTGCNTFEGIGKDMQSAGEGLASGATKVKKKINGNQETQEEYPSSQQSYKDNPSAAY